MHIARPPSGFHIIEPPTFRPYLDSFSAKYPRIHGHWDDIKQLLKMTGHREGAPVKAPGFRVFEAAADLKNGIPGIRVAYHILGDTLTFRQILVVE